MPETITIDDATHEMDALADRVRDGDVVAARRLADLWSAVNSHLQNDGTPPARWSQRPEPTVLESDAGEMFLDFGTLPHQPSITVTAATDHPGYATSFEAATPNLRTVGAPATPSTLGSIGWQHSLDAPVTSIAAHKAAALRAGRANHRVFWAIHDAGGRGRTDDELETWLNLTHQSVSATRRGLVKKGYLQDSGQTRLTRSNNSAIVWVLTDAAKTRIRDGLETRDAA